MRSYKIVLAEDHVLFRQGLKKILMEVPDLEIVGEAADGLELLEMLPVVNPDLVIMDISMPRLRGLEATQRISEAYPGIKVLILTMHKDPEYVDRAIQAGANGYLPKDGTTTELLSAINMIRAGQTYISLLIAI